MELTRYSRHENGVTWVTNWTHIKDPVRRTAAFVARDGQGGWMATVFPTHGYGSQDLNGFRTMALAKAGVRAYFGLPALPGTAQETKA